MYNHRGVEIKVTETTHYKHAGGTITTDPGKMFFVAESVHGLSLDAWSPQAALDRAKGLIDRALDK